MVKMHVFNERQLCKQIIFTEGCRYLAVCIEISACIGEY